MNFREAYQFSHLFSDDEVRVYAVAVFKVTSSHIPKDFVGFRGDWTAYIGGARTEDGLEYCIAKVAREGQKLSEEAARVLFPGLAKSMDEKKQPYRL